MECIICLESTTNPYKIKCGAKVAHVLCHSCETTLRLQTKPNHHGRTIKCPLCRKDENGFGNRTRASYEAELRMLYSELYPRILPFTPQRTRPAPREPPRPAPREPPRPAPREPPRAPPREPRAPAARNWCSNKSLQCPTKSKTTRKCTYPMGCENKVCRHCNMCASHFEF